MGKRSLVAKDDRFPYNPPLTIVGMDYFGPFDVKRARTVVKPYVHGHSHGLQGSRSWSASVWVLVHVPRRRDFVQQWRESRSTGTWIRNSKMWRFHSTEKSQQKNVTWIFNPPAGFHHGGVLVSLIRSVRKILFSLLRLQTLHVNDESLSTLSCELKQFWMDVHFLRHQVLVRTWEHINP